MVFRGICRSQLTKRQNLVFSVFLVVVDGEGMSNYNEQFVEAWKLTTNYQAWRGKEHAGIDDVHAG